MNRPRKDYGAPLRIYDYGPAAQDRYIILPPRSAATMAHFTVRGRDGLIWQGLCSGVDPRGCSGHVQCHAGPHLGKRITWSALPPAVQVMVRRSFLGRYCPSSLKGGY